MQRWRLFSLIVLTGLVIDQISKLYVDAVMTLYQTIPVLDGLFNITYLRNKGAAFSFLADASWRIPFFIVVTLVALVVILVTVHRLQSGQRRALVALALIFSGALGNLVDRVRLGEVIDFLDVYWKSYHWPAFNVADSLICIGVGLMAWEMLREERSRLRHQGR